MDVWQWFTGTVSFESMLQALGLGVLAWLFATDRIITKGQHLRRVDDIVTAHGLLIAAKDERFAEMRDSRNYYRLARTEERARAESATEKLAESVEVSRAALQALQALDEAARGSR